MTNSTTSSTRPIQLIVYHSRLFKAHWAILVPHSADTTVCTKVQVTGSLAQGFEHEFQRNYNHATTGRGHSVYSLGSVPEDAVNSVLATSVDETDTTTASNRLEEIALTVPAPGPSLRSAGSSNIKPIDVKDCQYWVRQYAEALIAAGLLDANAADVLATAPMH